MRHHFTTPYLRYGGDEFTLLVNASEVDPHRPAALLRDRLQREIDAEAELRNLPFHISFSIGAGEGFDKHETESTVIESADKQLYQDKHKRPARRMDPAVNTTNQL